MANVRTKMNKLPMTVTHREYTNKFNWQGHYQVPPPPSVPDPVYPERPKSTYVKRQAACRSGLTRWLIQFD